MSFPRDVIPCIVPPDSSTPFRDPVRLPDTPARRSARSLAVSGLSGLLLGVGARLTMRFVALEADVPAGFSVGGSLEVVAFGALVGTPAALVFFALRSRIRVRGPWVGPLGGLCLYAGFAAVPPPAARSALAATPDTPAATALAFSILFVAWGLGLEILQRIWLRRAGA